MMTIYDFVEKFFTEPQHVYDGIPLSRICRDDGCGIVEVHTEHLKSTTLSLSANKRINRNIEGSHFLACPSCMSSGRYDDGACCQLCNGSGTTTRTAIRLAKRDEKMIENTRRCVFCDGGKVRTIKRSGMISYYCGSCDKDFSDNMGPPQGPKRDPVVSVAVVKKNGANGHTNGHANGHVNGVNKRKMTEEDS